MAGPDGLWKIRLTGYRPGQPWTYEGDPPGANCKVLPELILHWRAYLRELEAVRRPRKTTCSRCDKQKELINQSCCRACDAICARQWRKRHPLTEEQRWKKNVRGIARGFCLRGKFRHKPCRHCGESRTERRHPDYARPLDVIWLCRPCRVKLHANKRRCARHHVKQQRKGRRPR